MRVPFLRSLLAAGAAAAALSAAVVPSASAAAPRIDPETACDGGLYDIIIVYRMPTVRCLLFDMNTKPGPGWWAPSVGDVVVDHAARTVSVRIDRVPGPNNTWLGWSTPAGTATAGDDFTVAGGELYFTSTSSSTLQQAWVSASWKDDGDTGEGPETFAIEFARTVVDVNAPQAVTVTIPADASYVPPVVPGPDPDPQGDPGSEPDPRPGSEPEPDPIVEPTKDDAPVAEAPKPTATGSVVPTAAAAGPAAVPAATVRAAVTPPPLMAQREQERTLASTLAARTRLPVACAEACTLTSTLTVSAATAKRLGLGSRTLGASSVRGIGRVLVPLRVRGGVRRALARSRRPVVVTVTVAGAGTPLVVRLTLAP